MAGIQIDFKYLPRITLENSGTKSIEFRNKQRKFNREHKLWKQKYTHQENSAKNIFKILLADLEHLVKIVKMMCKCEFYILHTILGIQEIFAELLELGVLTKKDCDKLLDSMQSQI